MKAELSLCIFFSPPVFPLRIIYTYTRTYSRYMPMVPLYISSYTTDINILTNYSFEKTSYLYSNMAFALLFLYFFFFFFSFFLSSFLRSNVILFFSPSNILYIIRSPNKTMEFDVRP